MLSLSEMEIKIAAPSDAELLLGIYAPYIRETAVTFEYAVPSVEEFSQRIRHTLEKYPYLMAVKNGEILGYVYAGPLHPRAAYAWSVETSIYVKKDKKQLGVGRILYDALEQVLKAQNMLSVNACIAYPEKEDEYLTRDSVRFHEHMGYRLVAEFHQCAYKFEQWYNMVWMEKHIGTHVKHPLPPKTFEQVRGMFQQWEK